MRNVFRQVSCWFAIATFCTSLESCHATDRQVVQPADPAIASAQVTPIPSASPAVPPPPVNWIAAAIVPTDRQALLQQSWVAYRQRFIQADGRVIDREADDRSTSEGQAYAMLRAVMIGDRDVFDRSLQWAEQNLQRTSNGQRTDSLWAWKWGRTSKGDWTIIDGNFASDADIDAITALILAARRWRNPAYLTLAKTKLQDLWNLSTVTAPQQGTRYLLPGPAASFQTNSTVQINPSYFAPYAFRLFAQVDDHARNWLSLVDSSYQVLQQASTLSAVGLPNDWILLDLTTGKVQPLLTANPGTSEYGFDAYRVWWRVALDQAWFKEPRAKQYLQKHLAHLQQLWRSQQKIPARIDLQGKPASTYEATSQYGMVYAALQLIDPPTARQIDQQKITPKYRDGFWDNDSAYYTQNMVWLGLMPPAAIAHLIKP